MADGILYLDIDDEITSAAARVRAVAGGRVAVVLPYGSRVATSRINFRLLARDALTHEKRLSVIASDSATRALAASAGLPVFASVQEYEASLPPPREPAVDVAAVAAAEGAAAETADTGSAAAVRKAKRAAAAAGADASTEAIWTETARVETPLDTPDQSPEDDTGRSSAAVAGVAAAGVAGVAAAGVVAASAAMTTSLDPAPIDHGPDPQSPPRRPTA